MSSPQQTLSRQPSARMASVGYMFTRGGVVVVGVENGPDVSDRLDAVTEVALSEGIDDFEALPPENDSLSRVKVRSIPTLSSDTPFNIISSTVKPPHLQNSQTNYQSILVSQS